MFVSVYDPRLKRFTHYSSHEDFNMNFLLKAQENPKAKIKQLAPIEVVNKMTKDSDDEESISDDSSVKN